MKIKTKRLILREWKMSDIDDIVSGLNEFDVAKNLTSPYPYTRDDAIEFLTKHRKQKLNYLILDKPGLLHHDKFQVQFF